MKKFGLDLSKFKKSGSDGKTTTLKSDDGHEIKVAHSALHPKMRAALAALPTHEGKKTEKSEAKPEGKPTPKGETRRKPEAEQHFAEGGEVKDIDLKDAPPEDKVKDIDLDKTPDTTQAPVVINLGNAQQASPAKPAEKPTQPPTPQQVYEDQMKFYKDNTPAMPPVSMENGALDAAERSKNIQQYQATQAQASEAAKLKTAQDTNARREAIGLPALPLPATSQVGPSPASVATPGTAPAAQGTPQGPSDLYGTEAYYGNLTKGIAEQKAGINQEAKAAGDQGKLEQAALQAGMDAQKQNAQTFHDHYNALEAERQAFVKDIRDQHIDPQHYLNSMGTGKKIATAVGLILGGMGGGITHTDNPVSQFLNDQITRDIDSQKAEMGKKENLLSANMKQFGNLRDATDMTRVMQSDLISNQLKMAAAKTSDPMAKARAMQAIGKIDADNASTMSQIAMRRGLLSGMQAGRIAPEHVVRMVVPKEEQVGAFKELKDAQELGDTRDNILSGFDQLVKINTLGNRAMNPIQAKRQIEAIKASIIPGLSKSTAGRYTEQDAGTIEHMFDTAGADDKTVGTQRARLVKLMGEKMHFPILKAYGIDVGRSARFGQQGQSRIQESAPVIGK